MKKVFELTIDRSLSKENEVVKKFKSLAVRKVKSLKAKKYQLKLIQQHTHQKETPHLPFNQP
jgi:dynactin complex subunit